MRKRLTTLMALSACSGLLLPVAGAKAKPLDGTYRGKTSQGYRTVVKVKGGVVESVSLPWVGKCRDKRYKWGPIKPFRWTNDPKEPIEQSGNHFSDSGRSVHDVKGEHSVSKGYMKGHFSGKRVSGVQDIKVHVTYKGEKDYCHARIHWWAKLVG
jgi:hypothetical protein